MSIFPEQTAPISLTDRLRDACGVTTEFLSEITSEICPNCHSMAHGAKPARVKRLIRSRAWTDAALALIDLELPQWQVRRLAYDGGEWHCALSRQRELPDWLDQPIETRHADLALAILSAFAEACQAGEPQHRAAMPNMPRHDALYEPIYSENFV